MKWTNQEIDLITSSKNNTINDLCISTGHNYHGVRQKARELGIRLPIKKRDFQWKKYELELLKKSYGNIDTKIISKQLNRSISGIRHKAQRLRLKGKTRKYSVDFDYFKYFTIQNCYWAGFIAADGCIVDNNYNRSVQMSLQRRDKHILERFVNDSKFSGFVKDTISNNKLQSVLNICGVQQWHDDLKQNFNIIPRKTLILQPPKLKERDHILSFIIGYLDGDGSIEQYMRRWKHKNGKYYENLRTEISFAGTEDLLNWIKLNIEKYILKEKILNKINKCSNTNNCHRLRICGKRARKIIDKLKAMDVPKLNRKWGI